MSAQDNPQQHRRRRLIWRCSHRGMKEIDILLGGYASDRVPTMSDDELDRFEAFCAVHDDRLFAWLTGARAVEDENSRKFVNDILANHDKQRERKK